MQSFQTQPLFSFLPGPVDLSLQIRPLGPSPSTARLFLLQALCALAHTSRAWSGSSGLTPGFFRGPSKVISGNKALPKQCPPLQPATVNAMENMTRADQNLCAWHACDAQRHCAFCCQAAPAMIVLPDAEGSLQAPGPFLCAKAFPES